MDSGWSNLIFDYSTARHAVRLHGLYQYSAANANAHVNAVSREYSDAHTHEHAAILWLYQWHQAR
jgi:hypothetical protein